MEVDEDGMSSDQKELEAENGTTLRTNPAKSKISNRRKKKSSKTKKKLHH